jgi:hypothetical protein
MNPIVQTVQRSRRLAAGPVVVRSAAGIGAAAAMVLAAPLSSLAASASGLLDLVLVAGLVGTVVALWPRGRWVTLVALGAILVWIVATLALGESTGLVRVGALAAALYVMHAAAALAAVLPFDTVVAPAVLYRWAGRVLSVLGGSLVVSLGAYALASQVPTARSVVGPGVGSAVAAGLVGFLAWLLLRRR